MAYHASDTVKQLIALLNNAKELSVDHSIRTLAIDSINSCKILCKSRNFGIKDQVLDVFDSLIYAIRSYKPEVILEELDKTEEFDIVLDIGTTKISKPKMPELPYVDVNSF